MWRSVWAVSSGVAALLLSACSGGDGSLPPGISNGPAPAAAAEDGGSVQGQTTQGTSAACTPFDKRDCVIDLGISDGVHNCAKGTQICENGAWSTCAALDL
jgi:hypothetical protein